MGNLIDGPTLCCWLETTSMTVRFRGNYSDFKYARRRMRRSCDVHIVGGTGKPGGVGELCVPAAAGAVANAYARATGSSPISSIN
jgi:isoquinoline 1-oxidoreductase beta subunit